MNGTERMYPPAEPDGETPVSENADFVGACMAIISADAERIGWRFENSALSRSDVWGLVFRIDCRASSEDQSPEFFTRYICWSDKKNDAVAGTAVISGHKLKPL